MPKWLFERRARSLCPAPDSSNPCASVILAGILYFFCCSIARALYVFIYFSYEGILRWVAASANVAIKNKRQKIRIVSFIKRVPKVFIFAKIMKLDILFF